MSIKPSHSICKKNLDKIKFWFLGLRQNLALWVLTEVSGKLCLQLLQCRWKQQALSNHAQYCTCHSLGKNDQCLDGRVNFRFHTVPSSVIILYVFISDFKCEIQVF